MSAARAKSRLEPERLREELRSHQEELLAQHASITESQRQLELSHEEYDELFDLGPLACFILDANGVIRRSNLAGGELLSIDRLRLANVPMMVCIVDSDRRVFLDHMRRCRTTDALVRTEMIVRTRGGTEIPIELTSREFVTRSHGRGWYHTTAVDLRERRRAEHERLRAAEDQHRALHEQQLACAASEAKDRFLAILSHELRTPLTPVLLATSTWKDDDSLSNPLRQALAMIHRNVAAEARLIDDLLDLTRIVQNKLVLEPTLVDLHGVIEEVFDSVQSEAAAAGVRIALDLRARPSVRGDAHRLRQIVSNLLRNAIHFTPTNGTVSVRTTNADAAHVRLFVSDDGVGFDQESADRLFEPFDQGASRRDKVGLGLGLAIAKGLVEAQQGTIAAFSDGPGRGARFEVVLPAVDTEPAVATPEPPERAPSLGQGPLRILLVEDHEDTSLALSYVLEHQGYVVERAESIAKALETMERSEIDMVVSDLGLPDGSGLDLMRTLKARKPVRAIALTGYGRREDIAEAREAGFDRHLTKPVDLPTLIATIESLRRDAA